MQDYAQLHMFLPASLWDACVDGQTSIESTLQEFQLHVASLGFAWFPEKTSQQAAAVLLLCQCGSSQTFGVSRDH
eukprot:6125946-Lingulodinium_polyedra.AAC.1